MNIAIFFLFVIAILLMSIGSVLIFKDRENQRLREWTRQRNEAKKRERDAWDEYCIQLEEWFRCRRDSSFDSSNNLLQERKRKILYALAQHEHSGRLQFWQLLRVWECDETGIERSRFDKAFQELWMEGFVKGNGANAYVADEARRFFLTDKGRDHLMELQLL